MERKTFIQIILALPFIFNLNNGRDKIKKIKNKKNKSIINNRNQIKIKKFNKKTLYEKHNLSG
jgi:hypothetical protein